MSGGVTAPTWRWTATTWFTTCLRPLRSASKRRRWCYPFVGCAGYRGYFRLRGARRKAAALQADGYETFIGGVDAYSTLGWFNDPLLSTFIFENDARLANLLLHELAHSEVWLAGDIAFNESFASFVGERAAGEWLNTRDAVDLEVAQAAAAADAEWQRLRQFLLQWRDALAAVYEQFAETPDVAGHKDRVMAMFRECYRTQKRQLGNGRFDMAVARVNNARLAAIGTYADFEPAFAGLFAAHESNWPRFFAAARELADLPQPDRGRRLAALTSEWAGAAPQSAGGKYVFRGADGGCRLEATDGSIQHPP